MELTIRLPINKFLKRDIGFRFDMLSWWIVCDMNGKELHEMGEIGQEQLLTDMLYAAYKSYCLEHQKKIKYSRKQAAEWGDVMTNKDARRFADALLNSKMFGRKVSEWGDKAEKKT